jgi:hypothetical protein
MLNLIPLQQATLDSGLASDGGLDSLGFLSSASAHRLGLTAADLLPAQQHPSIPTDTLQQQLAVLQQQQLAQALAAEPLLSLSNLLAAQQGLSTRVQELLVLKQQLQQAVPSSPSIRGGIRGTGPINNALYKVRCEGKAASFGAAAAGCLITRQGAPGWSLDAWQGTQLTDPCCSPFFPLQTELCRSWEETGSCRYGAKCQVTAAVDPKL